MEWWPIFWLFVALKIPLLAALGIVWWALKAEPVEPEEARVDRGEGRGPHAPRPHLPDTPRRGPHAAPAPASPRRVRVRSRESLVTHR